MENKKDIMSDNRRDFLKKSALVGLAATLNPLSGFANTTFEKKEFEGESLSATAGSKNISILITTDIHSQLNTHDEFFW